MKYQVLLDQIRSLRESLAHITLSARPYPYQKAVAETAIALAEAALTDASTQRMAELHDHLYERIVELDKIQRTGKA